MAPLRRGVPGLWVVLEGPSLAVVLGRSLGHRMAVTLERIRSVKPVVVKGSSLAGVLKGRARAAGLTVLLGGTSWARRLAVVLKCGSLV